MLKALVDCFTMHQKSSGGEKTCVKKRKKNGKRTRKNGKKRNGKIRTDNKHFCDFSLL
jgi:hypothetical protein